MNSYCCFLHPTNDYRKKELDDICEECGLPFGFPLDEKYLPNNIREFKVKKSLDRGYYGATYVVEKVNNIRTKKLVLKVVPKAIYSFCNKDFIAECQHHADVAEGTQHIVNIDDAFDEIIHFGSIPVECHIAVLDYIEGVTLKNLLEGNETVKAATIGQIAIDLLKILSELHVKQRFHNDLHSGNIIVQKLKGDQKRVGELDESVKCVAIDFGSLGEKSQSGDKSNRVGDLHRIANVLDSLSQKILDNPYNTEERDYRLASLLEERARILFPSVTNIRVYEFEEVIIQIRNAFIQVDSPWLQPLSLRNFKDSYNAQTLAPWFVPSLLVDDGDAWINEISNRGPQVITGMRGCGKTMLIRALQMHARASPIGVEERVDKTRIVSRIKQEAYLGLYVSCTRLLDKLGAQNEKLHEPFTRLFVAYAIEAINALRHLRELDRNSVSISAFNCIANAVAEHIEGAIELKNLSNEHEIEGKLKRILNSLSKGEELYTINANPANTFPQLASAIRQCSSIWQNSYVFFLLDDVSTRFLNDTNIIDLVSSLLFQNEMCSFKFTTEAQTLEMVIHSPGNIEKARIGRDYDVFDLGHEVNEKIHKSKGGIAFVEKILFKRSQFHSSHPNKIRPSNLLGKTSLQTIAENIANVGKQQNKKALYHGITCIASVCVGDIGDVITLYDMILKRRNGKNSVSANDQNECYLELCSSRLFDINRRQSRLFDFASSFAEAANFLLVQSYKQLSKGQDNRLRQYSSIFINITEGDKDKQYRQVRELIDAGIFNFSGGPLSSRTKQISGNPQQQFKLTYRKLYGLNKHIGLSQRDRFELKGKQLERWLENPKNGKDVLIVNKSLIEDDEDVIEIEDSSDENYENTSNLYFQRSLFDIELEDAFNKEVESVEQNEIARSTSKIIEKHLPTVSEIEVNTTISDGFTHFMTSLGFEDSTLESFKRLIEGNPRKVQLLQFNELGNTNEILKILKVKKTPYEVFTLAEATNTPKTFESDTLYDITGLPQSVIFSMIRDSLLTNKKVKIAYTDSLQQYPLDDDIKTLLDKHGNSDQTNFLESLTDILKGEKGPYNIVPLLPKEINPSARTILVAFSSPKHERLYSLLDERDYDKICIFVPRGNNPKNKLARIAAEVAVRKFNHAQIIEFDSDSLQDTIRCLYIEYRNYFFNQNFSFDIAITGTKLQTVASAVICSICKVNQCWYVKPFEWDAKRFTKGASATKVYSITTI